MKKFLIIAALALLQACTPAPEVSIFSDNIKSIARQEHISFTEAAEMIKGLGYEGVDIYVSIKPEELRILDSLGFKTACTIIYIDYSLGDQPEIEDKALNFALANNCSTLLFVPELLPEVPDAEVTRSILEHIDAYSRKCKAKGVNMIVEDYDNERSLCYNTAALDKMFEAAPELGHLFDTGNYLYCHEDARVALKHFRDRIFHVHLKDRVSEDNMACTAIGSGCIPQDELISSLMKSGYKGWFTVEINSRHMLDDARSSIEFIKSVK